MWRPRMLRVFASRGGVEFAAPDHWLPDLIFNGVAGGNKGCCPGVDRVSIEVMEDDLVRVPIVVS
jgi:hypothetical protein